MESISQAEDSSGLPGTPPEPASASQILVCLDRSEPSETIISYGVMLASAIGGTLTLMHVIEPTGNHSSFTHDALAWGLKQDEAQRYMERLQSRISLLNIPVKIQIEGGRAAEQILGFTRQNPVDYVILASHGTSGLTEWSLSGTAAKIICRIHSSFIIVPATPAYQRKKDESRIRRILIPMDDSLISQAVLPTAITIAKKENSELILAHSLEPASFEGFPGLKFAEREIVDKAASIRATAAKGYFQKIAERLQGENIKVSVVVTSGVSPVELINELVTSRNIDLIVMSAHGSSASEQLPLARTPAHMPSHSTVPLLIVQNLEKEQIKRALQTRRYDSAPIKSGE